MLQEMKSINGRYDPAHISYPIARKAIFINNREQVLITGSRRQRLVPGGFHFL
jgi:hypothetical protein